MHVSLSPSSAASLILAAILVLLPVAMWAEKRAPIVWQERLLIPRFEADVARHTAYFSGGVHLPRRVRSNLTLSAHGGPYVLDAVTTIPAGVALTIEAGTTILAREFSALDVTGELFVPGTPSQPVEFTTNEVHPDNQTWGGIVVNTGGRAIVRHAHVRHAAPALTCLAGSHVRADNLDIQYGAVGVFVATDDCTLQHSTIRGVREGVVAVTDNVNLADVAIGARRQAIRLLER